VLNMDCFSIKITHSNSDLKQMQEISRNYAENKVDLNLFGMESHLQREKLGLEIDSSKI